MAKSLITALIIAILFPTIVRSGKPIDGIIKYASFRFVSSIASDLETVYFGTTGGVIRYDKIYGRWLDPLPDDKGLPSDNIVRLAYDPQFDELWAQTSNGAAKFNLTFGEWYPETGFPESLVINEWRPNLFPSLFMPFRLSYQAGIIQDQFFRTFRVTAGIRDNQNDLMYVGTWGLGPGIINTRYRNYISLPTGPFATAISKVVEVGGVLWMGTPLARPSGALTKFDRRAGEWKYYEQTANPEILSAELLSAVGWGDYTWIGTRQGLLRIDGTDRVRVYLTAQGLPSDEILSLTLFENQLYVGTANGLGLLPVTGEIADSGFSPSMPAKYWLRGESINDLTILGGKLLIATDRNVYRYSSNPSKMEILDTPSGDLAAGASDIFTDNRMVYFAVGFGVVAIDIKTEESYVAEALPSMGFGRISQIYASDSTIWCATPSGLWRFDMKTGTGELLTSADGLPANSLNSIIADEDCFWIGSDKGLLKIEKNRLKAKND